MTIDESTIKEVATSETVPTPTASVPTPGPEGAKSVSEVVKGGLTSGKKTARRRSATAAVQHLNVKERRTKGRAARVEIPRARLSGWQPGAHRADPVALLTSQETTRVQELVPVRHARMAVSAFTFYRGAALVMAADLAGEPRSGLNVQLCGDAHLANFGLFAAPDRSVIFDVNDFDDRPRPVRMGRQTAGNLLHPGRPGQQPVRCRGPAAAEAVATSYRKSMAGFAEMREIDIWYDRIDVDHLVAALRHLPTDKGKSAAKREAKAEATIRNDAAKARLRDAWSAIEKITQVVDGQRRFRDQPPLLLAWPSLRAPTRW